MYKNTINETESIVFSWVYYFRFNKLHKGELILSTKLLSRNNALSLANPIEIILFTHFAFYKHPSSRAN